ncbi:hypothetical protein EVAR_76484_1 [Eumeta japonica]|uniref:Uncharacterized protein n=1 Tax=Eumeta variegata TaxID=151549 RepID=A0A4C1T7N0_EUMVA|nr:hypothetical protein EVAR_76484_1 [Eumeta japonica]
MDCIHGSNKILSYTSDLFYDRKRLFAAGARAVGTSSPTATALTFARWGLNMKPKRIATTRTILNCMYELHSAQSMDPQPNSTRPRATYLDACDAGCHQAMTQTACNHPPTDLCLYCQEIIIKFIAYYTDCLDLATRLERDKAAARL